MKRLLFLLFVFALYGCVEPFDIKVDEGEKLLVVNGMITDQPGPYLVKINKTTSFGGHFTDVNPDVKGAQITITDNLGVTETLTETDPGEYVTSATGIRGRVGGTYTLRIKLKNGQEYVSEAEKLQAVPAVERLYFDFKESTTIAANGNESGNPYFEMKIDTKDPAAEKNFYRWISVGTYEVETQPENYAESDKNGNPVPKPKDCCRRCWVIRTDYTATVTSDRLFNGNSLIGQPVSSIPITPQYLGIKYHIELKQFSITEKVYNYWKIMESQSAGTGSLQDPAPANAFGNITNVNNPDDRALGYFGASALVTKKIFLKRSDVPFSLPSFVYPDDCLTIPSASTTRPGFWE